VREVAPLITMTKKERIAKKTQAAVTATQAALAATPGKVRELYAFVTSPETHDKLREDFLMVGDIVRGKAKERFAPLVTRLANRAIFENHKDEATTTKVTRYDAEPIAAEE
jgi:CRISPR/Cas system CMR subunit Cmr4 (Cas7 group RAMP superfamily)